jgi:chromosome segregation ATPase
MCQAPQVSTLMQALHQEHSVREELQATIAELNKQVMSIEKAEQTARQQAQQAVQSLRRDVERVRNRQGRPPVDKAGNATR